METQNEEYDSVLKQRDEVTQELRRLAVNVYNQVGFKEPALSNTAPDCSKLVDDAISAISKFVETSQSVKLSTNN